MPNIYLYINIYKFTDTTLPPLLIHFRKHSHLGNLIYEILTLTIHKFYNFIGLYKLPAL